MFLNDPALRRIAAITGDVLPDAIWRFHTAELGARGELAKLLHSTSIRYGDSALLLDRVLDTAGREIHRLRQALSANAGLDPVSADRKLREVAMSLDRHVELENALIEQYTAWRACTGEPGPTAEVHRLLAAGDPAFGVVTLRHVHDSQWHVIPDTEAATRFGLTAWRGIAGDVTATDGGFKPTAYKQPEFLVLHQELVFELPACRDLDSACRSLLRWWAYRESSDWDGRTPDQLAAAELAALAE